VSWQGNDSVRAKQTARVGHTWSLERLEDRLLLAGGVDVHTGIFTFEPTTAATDPTNPNLVAVAAGSTLKLSTDGGVTFPTTVDYLNLIPAAYRSQPGFFVDGDSDLAVDANGNMYWTALAFTTATQIDVFVSRRDVATGTFATAVLVTSASNDPRFADADDKQFIAVDTNPLSSAFGNVYVVWTKFGTTTDVFFSRSTNQGATWSSPLQLSNATTEGFVWPADVSVGPAGDVYVGYHAFTCTAADLGRTFVLRSTNGGQSFPQKTLAFDPGESAITCNVQDQPGNIPNTDFWMQGANQPYVLPDPIRPGRVYVISNDDPNNVYGNGDDADIVIATSTDFGQTWMNGTVNVGPAGNLEVYPRGAINASGVLALSWYDNRSGATNAAGNFLLDVYTSFSGDGGLTFTAASRLSDIPFDPDLGAPQRFAGPPPTLRIGEYNGLWAVNGKAYSAWTGNNIPPTGQEILFDAFAIGLFVTTATPSGPATAPVSSIDLTFSVEVNTTTFSSSDVMIIGPKNQTIFPQSITQLSPTRFRLNIGGQSTPGTYTYTLGPDIRDFPGNQMDQNNNFTPGEPGVAPAGDQYQSSFSIPLDDVNTFPHPASANNPSIAVNPFDQNSLVGAFEDASDSNNPPGFSGRNRVGVITSDDGGFSWQHRYVSIPVTGLQAFDPTLAYDSTGRLAMAVGGFVDPFLSKFAQRNGIFVFKNVNDGQTWNPVAGDEILLAGQRNDPLAPIAPLPLGTTNFDDHPWLTSDDNPTSPPHTKDNLYTVWTRFYPDGFFRSTLTGLAAGGTVGGGDIFISRSNDFGQTWSTPLLITGTVQQPGNAQTGTTGTSFVQGPRVTVGPNGDVFVAYQIGTRIDMQRLVPSSSGNGFRTIGTGTNIQMVDASGTPVPPSRPFGTGVVASVGQPFPTNQLFTVNAFPMIEIGPDPCTVGVTPGCVVGRSNMYVAVANDPDGVAVGTDGGNIRFVRSIDGGVNWQTPQTLNTDAVGKTQFFPALSVDQSGNIGVSWYDAFNDPGNHNLDVFGRASADGGSSFGAVSRVTAAGFNPDLGLPPTLSLGDHIGLAASQGNAFVLWTDTRVGVPGGQQEVVFDRFTIGPAEVAIGPRVVGTSPRDIFDQTALTPVSGVAPPVRTITVEFDKPLDEAFAEDQRNWDLRRTGPDGVFDTEDDVQYRVTPEFSSNPIDPANRGRVTVSLVINFGLNPLTFGETALPAGNYRLTVEGDDPILGRNGFRLNQTIANPSGADDVRHFKVVYPSSFPTVNVETGTAFGGLSTLTPPFSSTNDTLSQAIAVNLREGTEHTARGTIGGASGTRDVDLFRVDLNAGDQLIVDLDARAPLESGAAALPPGTTLFGALRVFDTSGNQLALATNGAADPDTGNVSDTSLTFSPTQTGTYFIGVSCNNNTTYNPAVADSGAVCTLGFTGFYDLQVAVAPDYDVSATLNNDTFLIPGTTNQAATNVRLRPGVTNVIRADVGVDPNTNANDVDLYKVTLGNKDRLVITLDSQGELTNPLDAAIRVFNSAGVQVAISDPAGAGVDPSVTIDIDGTTLVAGDYYVGVSSTGNVAYNPVTGTGYAGGSDAGQYDLKLLRIPLINFDTGMGGDRVLFARADFTGVETGAADAPFNSLQEAIDRAKVLSTSPTDRRIIVVLGNEKDAPFVVNPSDPDLTRRSFNLDSNTMEIQAGAIVKLFNSNAEVTGAPSEPAGRLNTRGTFNDPVIFTSLRDDTRGGDTNLDGGATVADDEDWGGVRFQATGDRPALPGTVALGEATGQFSHVDGAELRFGGGLVSAIGQRFSPIHLEGDFINRIGATPEILNNLIIDSGQPAISADFISLAVCGPDHTGIVPEIDARIVALTGCQPFAVGNSPGFGPRINGNQIARASINGLFVEVGQISGVLRTLNLPIVLDDPTVAHVLTDNLFIETGGGTTGSLTMLPGIDFEIQSAVIDVRQGFLDALGAADRPVVITTVRDDTGGLGATYQAGAGADHRGERQRDQDGNDLQRILTPAGANYEDWGGIRFQPGTRGEFQSAVVAFGGGSVPYQGGIFVPFNMIEILGCPNPVAGCAPLVPAANNPPIQQPTYVNIRNSNIHHASGAAIYVRTGEVNITGNRITDTRDANFGRLDRDVGAAISVDPNTLDTDSYEPGNTYEALVEPAFRGNVIIRNALNALDIRGIRTAGQIPTPDDDPGAGTLSVFGRWDDSDLTHVIRRDLNVGAARNNVIAPNGAAVNLTIDPGVIVKMAGTKITVIGDGGGSGAASSLHLVGIGADATSNPPTPTRPVIITSIQDDATVVRGFSVGPDSLPGLAGVDDPDFETGLPNGIVDDPGEIGLGDDVPFGATDSSDQHDVNNTPGSVGGPNQWNGVFFQYFADDLPDEFSRVKGGSVVDHAELKYASTAITVEGGVRHSPFASDSSDLEGPGPITDTQHQRQLFDNSAAGRPDGGMPRLGNLGQWNPGDYPPSHQTYLVSGTTGFSTSLAADGWIDAGDGNQFAILTQRDVDIYAFTADPGTTIWVDVDASSPGLSVGAAVFRWDPAGVGCAATLIGYDSQDVRSGGTINGVTTTAFQDPVNHFSTTGVTGNFDTAPYYATDPFNGTPITTAPNAPFASGNAFIGPLVLPQDTCGNVYFVAVFQGMGPNGEAPQDPSALRVLPGPSRIQPLRDGGYAVTAPFQGDQTFDNDAFGGNPVAFGQYHVEVRTTNFGSNPTIPAAGLEAAITSQPQLDPAASVYLNSSVSVLRGNNQTATGHDQGYFGSATTDLGAFDPVTGLWTINTTDSNGPAFGPITFFYDAPNTTAIKGDWDGDGDDDIGTFDSATGTFNLDLNGNRIVDAGETGIRFGGASDRPIVGDWNGDGKDDIGVFGDEDTNDNGVLDALEDTDGRGTLDAALFTLDINGNRSVEPGERGIDFQPNTGSAASWVPVSGDFNRDGLADIGVFDSANAQWTIDLNANRQVDLGEFPTTAAGTFLLFGSPGDTPVTADWDGDGDTDLGTYTVSGGVLRRDLDGDSRLDCGADLACGTGDPGDEQTLFLAGAVGDLPLVGNVGAAAGQEFVLFRPSTGQFFRDLNDNGLGDDGSVVTPSFGPAFAGVLGDWDRDGDDDMAAFNPRGPVGPYLGNWAIDLNGNAAFGAGETPNATTTEMSFDRLRSIPMAGDWDSDGDIDPGVYNQTTGTWTLDVLGALDTAGLPHGDRIVSFAEGSIQFGAQGEVPVVGDWDGNGRTNIGVFNRSTAEWALDTTPDRRQNPWETRIRFGFTGALPVVGDWNGDGQTDLAIFRPDVTPRTQGGLWSIDFNGNRQIDATEDAIPFGPILQLDATDPLGLRRVGMPLVGNFDPDFNHLTGANGPLKADGRNQIVVYGSEDLNADNDVTDVIALPGPGGTTVNVAEDFDGDGINDFIWYVDFNGDHFLDPALERISFDVGALGLDVPFLGDFDGDRSDDLGTFRPSTGRWLADLDGSRNLSPGPRVVLDNFNGGTLSGFSSFADTNGTVGTGFPNVVSFDTTGTGASPAVHMQVGSTGAPAGQAGGGIFKNFTTQLGTMTVTADVAAFSAAGDAEAGLFQLLVDGVVVNSTDLGPIAANATDRGTLAITMAVTPGPHEIRFRVTRSLASVAGTSPEQYIDNVRVSVTTSASETNPNGWAVGAGQLALGGNWERDGGEFLVGPNVQSLATADFDNDGNLDIVTVNFDSAPNVGQNGAAGVTNVCTAVVCGVSIRYGDGRGGFDEVEQRLTAGQNPIAVAAADMNGDGRPDIVVANWGGDRQTDTVGNFDDTAPGSLAVIRNLGNRNYVRRPGHDANGNSEVDHWPQLPAINCHR